MYKLANIEKLKKEAISQITDDHAPVIYSKIINLAKLNNGLLAGPIAINLLTHTEMFRPVLDIFIDEVYEFGKLLADELSKTSVKLIESSFENEKYSIFSHHGAKIKWIRLDTVIPNNHCQLFVDSRPYCNIYHLGIYRKVDLRKLMTLKYEVTFLQNGESLQVMPQDLLAINLLKNLSEPRNASKWGEYYLQFCNLFKIKIGHKIKKTEVIGGNKPPQLSQQMQQIINICIQTESVYLFSLPRANILGDVQHILNVMNKENKPKYTTYKIYVIVPGDFMIEKHILQFEGNDIADIYNTITYDVVPVKWKKTKNEQYLKGTTITVLRHLLIAIWVLKITQKVTGKKIFAIENMRNEKNKLMQKLANCYNPTEMYHGTCVAPAVLRKKINKYITNYVPAASL